MILISLGSVSRTSTRDYKETAYQTKNDSSSGSDFQDSSPPHIVESPLFHKMVKSPAHQETNGIHTIQLSNGTYDYEESTKDQIPHPEQTSRFETRLPELPKIDASLAKQETSNASDPASPISLFLPSGSKNKCSRSELKENERKLQRPPSFWRLVRLSFAEWLYAVLGSFGAAIFGSFNPLLAYVLALIVTTYYRDGEGHHLHYEVNKWCTIITCMGVVTVVANFLQHFYFGIMGEKMTERVRRLMFSAMLRNEVGWFDEEENTSDTFSMRLANDATFVRAAFSNRLSIFIQDSAAVIVAVFIGMLLEWRLAFVASATLPFLVVSAIAQKMWLSGFSRGIQELHRKASLVLEDAVKSIYTVVAFCAGNKFLLFACNALLLWYTAISVKNGDIDLPNALKEYMVFSFATFALVEPFGLAPYILKRRESLISVFEIIDLPAVLANRRSAGLMLAFKKTGDNANDESWL
ncbi:unnamed protein product [Ilex paraguariensis]|uniref:ABC transmembrane type-1 domain-containing protein n=1 Tax=Ilex paraguariensis TaxID=185542 RepID=A0ABC8TPT0_9AQUA